MNTEVPIAPVDVIPPRYWGFISYSHRDDKVARRLHRELETYRIPKELQVSREDNWSVPARLHPIFRDREDLSSGPRLSETLRQALRESRSLIVICSPAAANSEWVNKEICYFKSLGRADRVFSFIVSGNPKASVISDDDAQECFPPAIRFEVSNDGTVTDQPAEPLAADARPDSDTWQGAVLKLIAGIVDVRLDDLRRREQMRQQRRRAVVSVLVALCLAVLSAFSIFSWVMWQRAEEARGKAIIAQDKAEAAEIEERHAKERAISEKKRSEELTNQLISYVSTIGTWFSDEVGTKPETLDLYKEFLAFNNEMLDELTKASPESEHARQLLALFLVFSAHAHVRAISSQEAEFAMARKEISQAIEILRQLHSHPEDPFWEPRNALFYTNLSLAQWGLHDKEIGLASAKKAVDTVELIDFTAIPQSYALAARVHSNHGTLLADDGQVDECLLAFRRAQQFLNIAIKDSSSETEVMLNLELHNLLVGMAHVQFESQQYSAAFDTLEAAKPTLSSLENRPGYGMAWTLRLYWSEYAKVCVELNKFNDARRALSAMKRNSQQLLDLPKRELPDKYREDTSDLQFLLLNALTRHVDLEFRANVPKQAIVPLTEAVKLSKVLAISSQSVEMNDIYVVRALQLMNLHCSLGQWNRFANASREFLTYCDDMPENHPDRNRLFLFRASAEHQLAFAAWEQGRLDEASSLARTAISRLNSDEAKNSAPEVLAKLPITECPLQAFVAAVSLAQDNLAEATAAIETAKQIDPTNEIAERWRLHVLLFASKTDEAIKGYRILANGEAIPGTLAAILEHEFGRLLQYGAVTPDIEHAMQEVLAELKTHEP